MCLRIFIPTARRIVLFFIFAMLPLSGFLEFAPPLKVFFGLPHVLIHDYSISLVAQIIFSYVLACIYASAYVSIEASLRKNYPHMNDIVEKWKPGEPSAARPVARAKPKPRRRKK